MKREVSLVSWPPGKPTGVRQVVVRYTEGMDMLVARRGYAHTKGYQLVSKRADGLIALYWNELNHLVRLGLEPLVE